MTLLLVVWKGEWVVQMTLNQLMDECKMAIERKSVIE